MRAAAALTVTAPLPVAPQTFHFSMSMTRACLDLAILIGKFDISFRIEDGTKGTYISPAFRLTREPVFRTKRERRGGGYNQTDYVGAEAILNYLRRYALRKEDPMDDGLVFTSDYNPQNIRFEWSGIVCFGRSGNEVYRGPLNQCPWPVKKFLKLSRWSGAWEIAAWEVCPLDDLRVFSACGAPFVSSNPAAVLMPDEIRLFKGDKNHHVVVQDSAAMACTWFDVYFSHNDRLYRLWAHNPD